MLCSFVPVDVVSLVRLVRLVLLVLSRCRASWVGIRVVFVPFVLK
jgi:hypothetical protein